MEKQYLRSERAHFMCPNMHFGMVFDLKTVYDYMKIQQVMEHLAEAHPFLRSLIAEDEEGLYYHIETYGTYTLQEGVDGNRYLSDFRTFATKIWDVRKEGLLKVFTYNIQETKETRILFVVHHLLCDGRGLMGLSLEFANDYVAGTKPRLAEERLIRGIQELPEGSNLPGISRIIVQSANKNWKKEMKQVEYTDYLQFAKNYGEKHPVTYHESSIDAEKLREIHNQCKQYNVTLNDYFMAKMYLEFKTSKVIMAVDIRKYFPEFVTGAMGNYATAMGVVCRRTSEDVMEMAKIVHRQVQKKKKRMCDLMLVLACYFLMNPELLDASVMAALGGFESEAGTFVGKKMFGMDNPKSYSITNLGQIENPNLTLMQFIPPASPAAKCTIGVVTLNEVLRACCSTYK